MRAFDAREPDRGGAGVAGRAGLTTSPPRRLPVVGGMVAWHLFLLTAALAGGALVQGLAEFAVATAALGFAAYGLLTGAVLEIGPRGLTRGFVVAGRFVGPTTVMAWTAIASLHTDWRRPGDDTALATTVRDRQGRVIHMTTAMGLGAYWDCLAVVAAQSPAARRSGLTDALLSQDPPGRRSVLSATLTASVLALLIVGLVGIHHLWARGPSTLERTRAMDLPDRSPDR